MAADVALHGFAFGECVEGVPPRSLGYRLLARAEPAPWAAEVEALARCLQAAPFPDDWPAVDLFCSVLLETGERLLAISRYGVADQTASRRRGGLECFGVVAPATIGLDPARRVARWLRQRRQLKPDLRTWATIEWLSALEQDATLDDRTPAPTPRWQPPWREGALILAATSPDDPDRRFERLEVADDAGWQWLPFIGPDFPLTTYADRGSLVAWMPFAPAANVPVGRSAAQERRKARRRRLQAVLGGGLLLLLAANLWATLATYRRVPPVENAVPAEKATPQSAPVQADPAAVARERFAHALGQVFRQESVSEEWTQQELLDAYQRLAARDERLRVTDPESRAALGAVALLSRRRWPRIETAMREALVGKGYDPELIELACRRVHESFMTANRSASGPGR